YGSYVLRLGAFLALDNDELYSLAFLQGAIAIARNGAVVHEHIFAIIPLDEAKTLGCIEPLDFASYAFSHDPEPPFSKLLEVLSVERPTASTASTGEILAWAKVGCQSSEL